MAFCDNTFAMPFAAMKLTGNAYTFDELIEYFNNPETRVGLGHTSEEKEIAFYNWNKNKSIVNLNTAGWYLAHIIPVGRKLLGKNIGTYFKNPPRTEWENAEDKIRKPSSDLSDEELSILKAHFLRLVHPLNSFVVPKRSLLAYKGKNIGEEPELISIVCDYIKTEFPKEYEELKNVMQIPEEDKTNKIIGQIAWGLSESAINKKKKEFNAEAQIQKPLTEKNQDLFDHDETEILQRTLNSIGKSVFLKLYPIVKANPDLTLKMIYKDYPEFAKYALDAQKTRLSNTRSIIRNGLDYEVLTIILSSYRLSSADIEKTSKFLKELI